ncbi:MAG: hypothetical protein AAF638_13695, partial [Pseudomonadota bacterium]
MVSEKTLASVLVLLLGNTGGDRPAEPAQPERPAIVKSAPADNAHRPELRDRSDRAQIRKTEATVRRPSRSEPAAVRPVASGPVGSGSVQPESVQRRSEPALRAGFRPRS